MHDFIHHWYWAVSLHVNTSQCSYTAVSVQAGNVVTGEMVEELILSGADIIKVGIGPGTIDIQVGWSFTIRCPLV